MSNARDSILAHMVATLQTAITAAYSQGTVSRASDVSWDDIMPGDCPYVHVGGAGFDGTIADQGNGLGKDEMSPELIVIYRGIPGGTTQTYLSNLLDVITKTLVAPSALITTTGSYSYRITNLNYNALVGEDEGVMTLNPTIKWSSRLADP